LFSVIAWVHLSYYIYPPDSKYIYNISNQMEEKEQKQELKVMRL